MHRPIPSVKNKATMTFMTDGMFGLHGSLSPGKLHLCGSEDALNIFSCSRARVDDPFELARIQPWMHMLVQ